MSTRINQLTFFIAFGVAQPGRYRSPFCIRRPLQLCWLSLQRLSPASGQCFTLVVLNVNNCINDVAFGPQISFAATVHPWGLTRVPTTRLPQLSRCVRLESSQNLLWFARRRHHRVNVVGPNVHSPKLPLTNLARLANSLLDRHSLTVSQPHGWMGHGFAIMFFPSFIRRNSGRAKAIMKSIN